MSKQVTKCACLLISPKDIAGDREEVVKVIDHWNAQIGKILNIQVEPVRWESHAVPDLAHKPQEVINRQILPDCDFGIALFWCRLGTETEDFDSGSVEEVEKLLKANKRVLVYFCEKPIPQEKLDVNQYKKLQEFKDALFQRGLVSTYQEKAELREKILLHISNIASGFASVKSNLSSVDTAPKPDIRVGTSIGFTMPDRKEPMKLMSVEVMNHSSGDFFLSQISFVLKNGKVFMPLYDHLFGERQQKRKIKSGEKYSFHLTDQLSAHLIENNVVLSDLVNVRVRDDIGRIFEGDPDEFQNCVKILLNPKV